MSQKSEKYAREIGRMQRVQGVKLENLNERVAQIESREWQRLELIGQDKQELNRLRDRVHTLEREQRRRAVSRDRITLVIVTIIVCTMLLWVSLIIFGMV